MSLMPTTVHLMHVPGADPVRDEIVQTYRQTCPLDVCVHEDRERRGVLWNHETIVRCMVENDTSRWSLAVQDDALPYESTWDHLPRALFYAPYMAGFLSLSHFSQHGERIAVRGIPYGLGLHTIWGQAVAYRRRVLPKYLDFVHEVQDYDATGLRKWDDGLMAVFNMFEGSQSAFTSVALFEHQDLDSTMGHVPGQWRHAASNLGTRTPDWKAEPKTARYGTKPNELQLSLYRALKARRGGN